MKIFFVGDNRTSLNWGRGASIALSQLLSRSFEISGRITGDYFVLRTAEAGYVHTLFPSRYYGLFRRMLNNQKNRRIFRCYVGFERRLGARDFISEDPVESVDTLLSCRARHPALRRIYDQAREADLMVLDGDGDIIFSTPPRRETLFLLSMIELGLRLQKPVFLVNTMISDCPQSGRNLRTAAAARNLFRQCRAVALRDPESLEYVQREMPETNCCYLPDSLFAWFSLYQTPATQPPANGDFLLPHPQKEESWGKLDFSEPYVCFGGGASAASRPEEARRSYGRLIDAIRQLGHPVYLTENDAPDAFLEQVGREKNVGVVPADVSILMGGSVLAHARLFISGRYHPSIFASLGGTPCIFLGSHAHKMGSLGRVLEYEDGRAFDACPDENELAEIVAASRKYLAQGESLRRKIKQVAKKRSDEAARLPAYIRQYLESQQA